MDGDCMYEASHEDNELLRIIGDGLSGTKTFSWDFVGSKSSEKMSKKLRKPLEARGVLIEKVHELQLHNCPIDHQKKYVSLPALSSLWNTQEEQKAYLRYLRSACMLNKSETNYEYSSRHFFNVSKFDQVFIRF